MLTPNETHELLKLHEKLDTLTKALHNLNLKAEVFEVDLSLHEKQVDEIKSEIFSTLDKINQRYSTSIQNILDKSIYKRRLYASIYWIPNTLVCIVVK